MNILKARFDFSITKNKMLLEMRGVSFHNIIDAIAENGILLNVEHPNKKKYPRQFMLVVEYNNYTYCVPYKKTGQTIYLITIFPNRDYMYLLKDNKNGKNQIPR